MMNQRENVMEVDVWVRGSNEAITQPLANVAPRPSAWTDGDVRTLLTEMLLALERVKNPGGDVPSVSLRGFSWIVSPAADGVLVHVEMQSGTASAGPFAIGERQLTEMISRAMGSPVPSSAVH
ncbi:MAG: hypothetical protein ACRD2A_09020 [Vicinamibacterales bacterium]